MENLNRPEIYIPIIVTLLTNILLGTLRWVMYLVYVGFWFIRLNIIWFQDYRIINSKSYMKFKEWTSEDLINEETKAKTSIYWKYMKDRLLEELKKNLKMH